MQGSKIAANWPLLSFIAALAVVSLIFLSRSNGDGPQPRVTAPTRVSQALASTNQRTPAATPAAVATPTFAQILLAADQLRNAGLIRSATPTLQQVLQAADALVKAGAIPPPPSMLEILTAADQLAKAGVITPPPTLEQILLAADALQRAGLLPPAEPAPEPPLIDALRAAALLQQAQNPDPTVAPPPPPTPAPPPPPPPPATPKPAVVATGSGYWDEGFTQQVLALVNQRRAAAGLGSLAPEPRLAQAARAYAKTLADDEWFSHTGPDGSTLVTRVEATGFPFDVQIGEVLAWGTDNWQPAEIIEAWMDSPGHREQILGPYTRAGAGCYFTNPGNPTVRCVIDFAG